MALLATLVVFVACLAFVIRRNVTARLVYLEHRMGQLVGRNFPTQFDVRKTHYAEEKHLLIEDLVRVQLPTLLADLLEKRGAIPVALAVDSGTTLEPFFARVKHFGLGRSVDEGVQRRLQIYTNNLSGGNAFCKEPSGALASEQLHLFGGTPMEKYRAVTGEETEAGLAALKNRVSDEKGIVIGLITANWFVIGAGYDRLMLCSSEPSHLAYKRKLSEVSDYFARYHSPRQATATQELR